MKNKLYAFTIGTLLSFGAVKSNAQGVAVNASGAAANASSMLDVSSTTKGMLVPRMTNAQRNAISSPATGLLIFQTDGTSGFYYYDGAAWTGMGGGGSGTVTSVSSGNLSPVFTSSVSSATTTPSINYTLSSATAYTVLTNSTNATGVPSYAPVVPQALFATAGTPSSTTYYRGDGSWGTPVQSITAGTGLTGGGTGSSVTVSLPTVGTAGTYGSGSLIPVITTDAQGRVSSVTTTAVSGGSSYGTIRSVSASGALTSSDAIVTTGTNGLTMTLPLASSVPAGYQINLLYSSGLGNFGVVRSGSDLVFAPGGGGLVSTTVTFTQYCSLVSDHVSKWYIISYF
jgi:hypothetical protein